MAEHKNGRQQRKRGVTGVRMADQKRKTVGDEVITGRPKKRSAPTKQGVGGGSGMSYGTFLKELSADNRVRKGSYRCSATEGCAPHHIV